MPALYGRTQNLAFGQLSKLRKRKKHDSIIFQPFLAVAFDFIFLLDLCAFETDNQEESLEVDIHFAFVYSIFNRQRGKQFLY